MTLGLTDKTLRDAVRSAIAQKRSALLIRRSDAQVAARKAQVAFESAAKVRDDANRHLTSISSEIASLDVQLLDLDRAGAIGFAPSFSLNKEDYVYVAQSRSGGKSHTTRYEAGNWRCDCKSGIERGWCWVTKAMSYPGVKADPFTSKPFITDERGRTHEVARFVRAVI